MTTALFIVTDKTMPTSWIRTPFLFFLLVFLSSCIPYTPFDPFTPEGEAYRAKTKIKSSGRLLVLTRYAPNIYTIGANGEAKGFEHDFMQAFGDYLGVKVEFIVLHSVSEILKSIQQGHGDIAVSSLTKTRLREEAGFAFGPDYGEVEQRVVCRKYSKYRLPKKIADLHKIDILVIKGGSYLERLEELKKTHPLLKWRVSDELTTEMIFQKIVNRKVGCTIADSNIFKANRKYYPLLVSPMPLNTPQKLAWILAPRNKALSKAIGKWMQPFLQSDEYADIKHRYFGHVDKKFDYNKTAVFHKAIRAKLGKYRAYFKEAGTRYGIPWRLLAAQAYQESNWKSNAKSKAGAEGIMMLMPMTAKEIGVHNVYDPKENIMGGAKYLKRLIKGFSKKVNEKDRLWFALAAYNVGWGHLSDAQKLCTILGKDPSKWMDVKYVLPKLKYKKYRKFLRYGRARGSETVYYIDNIKLYWEMIEKMDLKP